MSIMVIIGAAWCFRWGLMVYRSFLSLRFLHEARGDGDVQETIFINNAREETLHFWHECTDVYPL